MVLPAIIDRLDCKIRSLSFSGRSGLSVRDPNEGSLEGRARRLIGGSKTRPKTRHTMARDEYNKAEDVQMFSACP